MAGNQSRADSSGQRKAEAAALVDGHHALAALVVAFLLARLVAAVQAAGAPRQAPPVLAGRQADRAALAFLICYSHHQLAAAIPGGCGGGIGIGCS